MENVRAFNSSLGRIRMLGGERALDLANTLHWSGEKMLDFVPDYQSLAKWSVPALLVSADEAEVLLDLAARAPASAGRVHTQWVGLRGKLKDWLFEFAPNRGLRNEKKAEARRLELVKTLGQIFDHLDSSHLFAIGLNIKDSDSLDLPLLRSATAIVMLILFPPSGKLRQCAADHCGGFFIDNSRAKPRRWCAMDRCGNRAKAKRHRQSAGGKRDQGEG